MSSANDTCTQCGTLLDAAALGGLCPQCVALDFFTPAPERFEPTSSLLRPGDAARFFGDYELLEEIARGGMGVVFKARQISLDRVVAVKMIAGGLLAGDEAIARFKTEAAAAAGLQHPNIVAIHEIGECQGQHYFSMDYVPGPTLGALAREGPLPAKRAASYVRRVAEAVHFAHSRGVLHRDLKPSNVLLDPTDEPRVTDFGLAKRLGAEAGMTRSDAVMGTPNYMAPEQAQGKSSTLTTAADVYSLGAILFYLLTGRAPFEAPTPVETLRKVIDVEPPRPTALRPDLDRDLETICLKCLEKDPARRYTSALALAEDLQRWLSHEPILARPSNALERAAKWTRRRPAIAALISVCAIAAGGFLLQRESGRRDLQEQRDQAIHQERLTKAALTQLELERTEEVLASENWRNGVATLARLLRGNPTNHIAAERLISTLSYQNVLLPVAPSVQPGKGVLHAAHFSPDGTRMVTASEDGTVRVWDTRTSQPVTPAFGPTGVVLQAHFSADGRRLVTASRDRSARVWDASTGVPLTGPLQHEATVYWAEFSPDGRWVASASKDGTARLWNGTNGQAVGMLNRHRGAVILARFSPDGQKLLTASSDGTARIWDVARTNLLKTLRDDGALLDASWSPDGSKVATAAETGSVRLWDAMTATEAIAPIRFKRAIQGLVFSPDGCRLALGLGGTRERLAWIIDLATGARRDLEHAVRVSSLRFSPDGQRLVTGTFDGTIRLWDVHSGRPLCVPLRHGTGAVQVEFSPDGRWVLCAAERGTATVLDARPSQALPLRLPHAGAVGGAEFSDDGRRAATHQGRIVRIWDAISGEPLGAPLQHPQSVSQFVFAPDGSRVLTLGTNGVAWLWNSSDGSALTISSAPPHQLVFGRFSADSARLVTAASDGAVSVWDAGTARPLAGPFLHSLYASHAEFSPDGRSVASSSYDRTARIWDAQTGKALLQLKHPAEVIAANFSPDGQWLATLCHDGGARVFDARTGTLLHEMSGDAAQVRSLRFSPDGRRWLTTSLDENVQIWNASTGRPATRPLKHADMVEGARFSQDGRRILTASRIGIARLWDVGTGLALSESFREGSALRARFSPDGQRVLVATLENAAHLWEVPRPPVPVPEGMLDLAEAVAGQRLDEAGAMEVVPADRVVELRERTSRATGTDFYNAWARWFFADRADRTLSAFSTNRVMRYVEQLTREGFSWESLQEALRLSPTNALALARLSRHFLLKGPEDRPPSPGAADWCSRRARQLAPDDPDVLRICQEVQRSVQVMNAAPRR